MSRILIRPCFYPSPELKYYQSQDLNEEKLGQMNEMLKVNGEFEGLKKRSRQRITLNLSNS